jgi:hypothetical protein
MPVVVDEKPDDRKAKDRAAAAETSEPPDRTARRWPSPSERRPIVGPRLSAAMPIILGALLAMWSVIKLWEIAV